MAKGVSTCSECGNKVPTEDALLYSSKKYCKLCHAGKLEERKRYTDLVDCIILYFKIDCPTGLMFKQIKEYIETYNFSHSGIQYTLWYCKEIKNLHFEPKYGIAIVKYEYENAKLFYNQQQKITDSIQAKPEEKIRTIQISKNKNMSKRSTFMLNLDELIKEGDPS